MTGPGSASPAAHDAAPELTCFLHPSWQPRLRPAGSRRDWMEETPERFAYRCLPLAIANAHGWEIGSPCGFRARWNGGMGADAVEIEVDAAAGPDHRPVSLFGAGTITFHVEGLFRTSPGWNLWVGGPPNAAKDGLAPLTGVIETDWSPYTFTMNWRFTRAGEWVRFQEDEPFCFLFPVQRGVIERVEPRIRPLSDAPDLADAFGRWSASRDAFQAHVRRTNPPAPADRWQKLYYRGVGPDGEPGVPDHESKLRPLSFRPAAACLIASGATPLIQPETMDFVLRNIGFAPGAIPSPSPPAEPTRAQARRDWLAAVSERQRALSPRTAGVPRLHNVCADAFLDLFYAQSRPVVIEGALAGWPALPRWTPSYLAKTVGDAEITYQGGRGDDPEFELHKDRHTRTMPFDRYIAAVTGAHAGGNDAYITAYNSAANRAALAPLQRDLGRLPWLDEGEGMLWIGPAGTFTPLHHDLTNNLLVQVAGTKRLHLLPPAETPRLANTRHVFSDVHDITDPTCIARHPEAAEALCYEVEIGPGDCLFIPVGWWHQVQSVSFSAMLTYTNFIWPNDAYATFPHD